MASMRLPGDLAGKVSELARDVVGNNPLEAGHEFLLKEVVPELKPVLLAILDDIEKVVADGFQRAEKSIKKMCFRLLGGLIVMLQSCHIRAALSIAGLP